EETNLHAQGYFVYDSRKAGSTTVSHLRFGPTPIRSTYLIDQADFVACHQESFLQTLDVLKVARLGATFLLNTTAPPERVWDSLPVETQTAAIEKKVRFFAIDAGAVAERAGLGRRINTVMQACFFGITELIPVASALDAVKKHIQKSYGSKSDRIV